MLASLTEKCHLLLKSRGLKPAMFNYIKCEKVTPEEDTALLKQKSGLRAGTCIICFGKGTLEIHNRKLRHGQIAGLWETQCIRKISLTTDINLTIAR